MDGLDAGLATNAAGRGGKEVAAEVATRLAPRYQSHLDDVLRVKLVASAGLGVAAMADSGHVAGADDALGEEKPGGELEVVSRSTHGDHDRLPAEADLARLLHRQDVADLGHVASIDLRHHAFEDGVVQEAISVDGDMVLQKHEP